MIQSQTFRVIQEPMTPARTAPTLCALDVSPVQSRLKTQYPIAMAIKHAHRVRSRSSCIAAVLLGVAAALTTPRAVAQQLFFPVVGASATQTQGTIASGNTFQTALAANPNRKGCLIQNTSTHSMSVFVGELASATAGKSFQVAANGGLFSCNYGSVVLTGNVNVTTSSTSDTFVVMSMQ